jgi:hypothetical protein
MGCFDSSVADVPHLRQKSAPSSSLAPQFLQYMVSSFPRRMRRF